MSRRNPFSREKAGSHPDYVWMEKANRAFKDNYDQADTAELRGLIAEGHARLDGNNAEDPVLECWLGLITGEAHIRLALESAKETEKSTEARRGIDMIINAAETAAAESPGSAFAVLPRAAALLGGVMRAMPEAWRKSDSEKLAEIIEAGEGAEQSADVLRARALEIQTTARLMVSDLAGLSAEDKEALLVRAAQDLIAAGEMYTEAGDSANVARTEADLRAVNNAIANEMPDTVAFSVPDGSTSENSYSTLTHVTEDEDRAGATSRRRPLKRIIASAGMMFSLGLSLYSGVQLLGSFLPDENPAVNEISAVETQNMLTLTQLANESKTTAENPESTDGASTAPVQTESAPQPLPDAGQERTSISFRDDFSSNTMGWAEQDSDFTRIEVMEGELIFQHRQPDSFELAFLPVDFIPTEISFDAAGPSGAQDGTFGLFCQFTDRQNYFYVEFDLVTREFIIAQSLDGNHYPLTDLNDRGSNRWQPAEGLRDGWDAVNRFEIACYPDSVSVWINGLAAASVRPETPLAGPGQAALFVYVFDFAGEPGYTVQFDNVEAYERID